MTFEFFRSRGAIQNSSIYSVGSLISKEKKKFFQASCNVSAAIPDTPREKLDPGRSERNIPSSDWAARWQVFSQSCLPARPSAKHPQCGMCLPCVSGGRFLPESSISYNAFFGKLLLRNTVTEHARTSVQFSGLCVLAYWCLFLFLIIIIITNPQTLVFPWACRHLPVVPSGLCSLASQQSPLSEGAMRTREVGGRFVPELSGQLTLPNHFRLS